MAGTEGSPAEDGAQLSGPAQDRDPRYGWLMVAVVFTLSLLSFGSLGAVSVFLKPLATEFGWSRGETSLGYTTVAFSSALFGVLWGFVADRIGTRWFGVVAAVVMTFSLFMLSRQSTLLEFYAFYFLFGALGNAMVTSPLFANVGFWFRNNPGLALGITASGGAAGQGIVPVLAGMAIEQYGWETAYQLMAGIYFCIAFPVAFLIRESPRRIQARLDPTSEKHDFPLSEIEVVVWISIAIIFCCNCMSVPIVHLVPLLTDRGHSVEFATSALLVLMLSGAVGRIFAGRLGDMIGALPAYMIMSLGQTSSVLWFPHIEGTTALYLLAAFFGFTYSGVMTSILVCTRTMVSAGFAARAMSLTSFFGWNGMGMGVYVGGVLFDMTGAYDWSFAFASAAGAVNLVILVLFYLRIRGRRHSAG